MKNININVDVASFKAFFNKLGERLNHINSNDVLYIIAALFVPPLAVLLKVGFTSQFFINLILTVLGFVPGQLHALWIVLFW